MVTCKEEKTGHTSSMSMVRVFRLNQNSKVGGSTGSADGAIKIKVSKLQQGERDSENLLGSRNLLIENWLFLDSPHFTVNVKQVILSSLLSKLLVSNKLASLEAMLV